MAHQSEQHEPGAETAFRAVAREYITNGAGLGDAAGSDELVGLQISHLGAKGLVELVGMGAALSLGANEESGADHQAASVGNIERGGIKESQRAFGKHEQPHSTHQTKGVWISQQRAFSQRHLLSLRRAGFVSTSD